MGLTLEKVDKIVGQEVHLKDIDLHFEPGSPKAKVNEKPKGETVNYDDLIKAWREGRVK